VQAQNPGLSGAELNPATSREDNEPVVYQLALASKRRLAALGYDFN